MGLNFQVFPDAQVMVEAGGEGAGRFVDEDGDQHAPRAREGEVIPPPVLHHRPPVAEQEASVKHDREQGG